MKMMMMFPAVILLLWSSTLAAGQGSRTGNYEDVKLTNSPGLYFEKVYDVRFKRAEWKMITFVDVQVMDAGFFDKIEEYDAVLRECEKNNVYGGCKSEAVENHIAAAKNIRAGLKDYLSGIAVAETEVTPSTMKRRGAMFGVLTDRDAKEINSDIDQISKDQVQLTSGVKKQTLLVASGLQELHRVTVEHHEKIEEHRRKIKQMIDETGILKENINALDYQSRVVAEYVTNAMEYFIHYRDSMKRILQAVHEAREGDFDENLLTPGQLKTAIREIHDLTHDYELLIPHKHQSSDEIGRITSTEVAYKDGRILVIARIPLADRVNYPLYRIHTWPTPQIIDNATISAQIIPQTRYIGLSDDHQAYFLVDAEYVDSCIKTTYYCTLCESQVPLYDVTTSDKCEVSLLLKPDPEALRQCDVRIKSTHKPFWSRLNSSGAWLYSLDKPEIVQIICRNAKFNLITISGTGILYLKSHCMGKTNYVTLPGMETISPIQQYIYQPELSLDISKILPELKQQDLIELIKERPASEKAKFELGKSIYELEEQLEGIGVHRRRDQFNEYLAYGSYVFQFGLIVIIIFMGCREKILTVLSGKNWGVYRVAAKETSYVESELEKGKVTKQPGTVPLAPARRL